MPIKYKDDNYFWSNIKFPKFVPVEALQIKYSDVVGMRVPSLIINHPSTAHIPRHKEKVHAETETVECVKHLTFKEILELSEV